MRNSCQSVGVHEALTAEIANRLLKMIDVRSDEECWPWIGTIGSHGYGVLGLLGSQVLAHRAVYEISHGDIPQGMLVRHSCDNPVCCNPSHLLVGTIADNMRDKCDRGRQPNGQDHGRSRLRERDVEKIVEMLLSGVGPNKIATDYGVRIGTIIAIRDGRTWPSITKLRPLVGPCVKRRKLSVTSRLISRDGSLPRTGVSLSQKLCVNATAA